jgi:hypothetical protein
MRGAGRGHVTVGEMRVLGRKERMRVGEKRREGGRRWSH